MLRITTHRHPEFLTFRLEGKLAGPWVREVEGCWLSTPPGSAIRFDLTGLTFIDAAGKAFLAARHAGGAELVACGCLMRSVVAEITAGSDPVSR
jgi:hypothetical protein